MPPNRHTCKEPAFYTRSRIVLNPTASKRLQFCHFQKNMHIEKSFLLTCDLINQNP